MLPMLSLGNVRCTIPFGAVLQRAHPCQLRPFYGHGAAQRVGMLCAGCIQLTVEFVTGALVLACYSIVRSV